MSGAFPCIRMWIVERFSTQPLDSGLGDLVSRCERVACVWPTRNLRTANSVEWVSCVMFPSGVLSCVVCCLPGPWTVLPICCEHVAWCETSGQCVVVLLCKLLLKLASATLSSARWFPEITMWPGTQKSLFEIFGDITLLKPVFPICFFLAFLR